MRPSPVSLAVPLVVTSAGVEAALVVAEASEASVVLLADSST